MKNKEFINLLPVETERLIIKLTSLDDLELLLKMDKQEETQKYLGGIKNKSREERIEFLNKKINKIKNGIASSLTVYLKAEDIPIAFIGLKINEENNSGEISYIFDVDYTKKGYCKEATTKLIEIGFNILKLDKIVADTVDENLASRKLLEKLNFKITSERTEEKVKFINYELQKEEFTI